MSPAGKATTDAPKNPKWLKSVENVGERSALMVVKTEEGEFSYLIPRISLFDLHPSLKNGNGSSNGHNGRPNGKRHPE